MPPFVVHTKTRGDHRGEYIINSDNIQLYCHRYRGERETKAMMIISWRLSLCLNTD